MKPRPYDPDDIYPQPTKDAAQVTTGHSGTRLNGTVGRNILQEKQRDARVIAYPIMALISMKLGWSFSRDIYAFFVGGLHSVFFRDIEYLQRKYADPHYPDYRLAGAVLGAVVAVLILKLVYVIIDRRAAKDDIDK